MKTKTIFLHLILLNFFTIFTTDSSNRKLDLFSKIFRMYEPMGIFRILAPSKKQNNSLRYGYRMECEENQIICKNSN